MAFFRNKWVRLILILDAMAVVAFLIFMIMNVMKTSVLYLDVTPVDAQILVNGSEYTSGSYKVMPGTYEVEISHEGMATKSFTVELGGDTIANITTFLVGEDGGFGFYELKKNYGSFTKLAEMVGAGDDKTTDHDASAEEFIARAEEDLNIYESGVLPIKYHEYKDGDTGGEITKEIVIWNGNVADGDECEKFLCLDVMMLYTDDVELVKKMLEEKGYRAGDYEIIYNVY